MKRIIERITQGPNGPEDVETWDAEQIPRHGWLVQALVLDDGTVELNLDLGSIEDAAGDDPYAWPHEDRLIIGGVFFELVAIHVRYAKENKALPPVPASTEETTP